MGLGGIGDFVEELGGGALALGVGPFGVAPALGADGVTVAVVAAADLGEGGGFGDVLRVVEHGAEIGAVEIGGAGETAEGGKRRVDIDHFHEGLGGAAVGLGAGGGNDERHAGAALEETLFLPETVVAEVVAVVAGENDHGVLREAEAVEGVDDAAELRVHEGDGAVISLDSVAAERVGEFALGGVGAEVGGGGCAGAVVVAERGQRDFIGGVELEPFFRGDVWRVRTVETDGEEERPGFAFEALEQADRLGGADAVGVVDVFALVVGEPAQRAAE